MSMSPDLRDAQAGFDGTRGSCPTKQDERHKQDL